MSKFSTANQKLAIRRQQILIMVAACIFGILLIVLRYPPFQDETINVMLQSEKNGQSIDQKRTSTWEQKIAKQFEQEKGVKVSFIYAETKIGPRLEQVLELLDPSSSLKDEVDVVALDVIWPRVVAEFAEDLTPYLNQAFLDKFNPKTLENNTVPVDGDDRLVAVPWFVDYGLLFYRTDLLTKYGYNNPPETWDQLETMAKKIQDGERLEHPNFWGFVSQNDASEGLTCNALEWQASHGGGMIVIEKEKSNIVDIDIKATAEAFDRAKKWFWNDNEKERISPLKLPGSDGKSTDYTHKEAFQLWRAGNAAFMRNWLYAYFLSVDKDNRYADLQGKIDVTLLPKGNGLNARHASTLGGWQLMVNTNSQGRKKKAAIEFVKFLVRDDIQKSLAFDTGKVPANKALYEDAEILKNLPFLFEEEPLASFFRGKSGADGKQDSAAGVIVRRPSTLTGKQYPSISEVYFDEVHDILQGNVKSTEKAVEDLRDIKIKRHLDEQ